MMVGKARQASNDREGLVSKLASSNQRQLRIKGGKMAKIRSLFSFTSCYHSQIL